MLTKIFKYRILIWHTVYLLIKYSLIRIVLSDKRFIAYLSSQDRSSLGNPSLKSVPSPQEIIKLIRKILNAISPNGNCLVLCLIKRDILFKHGFNEPILLGVKNTDQGLKAHAWLAYEGVINYKLVYLLP